MIQSKHPGARDKANWVVAGFPRIERLELASVDHQRCP